MNFRKLNLILVKLDSWFCSANNARRNTKNSYAPLLQFFKSRLPKFLDHPSVLEIFLNYGVEHAADYDLDLPGVGGLNVKCILCHKICENANFYPRLLRIGDFT